MINERFLLIVCTVFFHIFIQAQTFLPLDIPVKINNKILKYPWTGGLNTPQIMNSKVIGGAETALITVFDRTGGVWIPFAIESGRLIYRPKLKARYPPIKEWAHMVDFNGDGFDDLFTYSTTVGVAGIDVYQNNSGSGSTNFSKIKFPTDRNDILYYSSGNSRFNIYVSNIDYPSIIDIDRDGDVDIVTYDIGGIYINWFKNQAQEKKLPKGSFDFVLADPCFGKILEDGFSEKITLSADRNKCATGLQSTLEIRHSGSTVLAFDKDLDKDYDLLIGDISSSNLIFLRNGGDSSFAWMDQEQLKFPQNSIPVDIPYFVSSHMADINGDGVKELFAASNFNFGSDNYNSLWRYDRKSILSTDFEFVNNTFITDETIDFGENTYPAIVDVDGDSLLDIIVGSGGFFDRVGIHDAAIFYFKNTGSRSAPAFTLVDSNWLNFKRFNAETNSFAPTFGDIDNDGDLDLVVGELLGKLFIAINNGGKNKPMKFESVQSNYFGIDVGQYSTPIIYDLDVDNKPDLIIGERDGVINFFKNKGTTSDPLFSSVPDVNPLGKIDTRLPGFATGNSSPFLISSAKEKYLAVGTSGQGIHLYNNIKSDTSAFTKLSNRWGAIHEGDENHIAVADINSDGKLDALVGNLRGGLAWYHSDLTSEITVPIKEKKLPEVVVYPNPANSVLNIELDRNALNTKFKIISIDGKLMGKGMISVQKSSIDISYLPGGLYLLSLENEINKSLVKFLVY